MRAIALVALLATSACGGDSRREQPVADYSVNEAGIVSCPGAYWVRDLSNWRTGAREVRCLWDCARFDGKAGVAVELSVLFAPGSLVPVSAGYQSAAGSCD